MVFARGIEKLAIAKGFAQYPACAVDSVVQLSCELLCDGANPSIGVPEGEDLNGGRVQGSLSDPLVVEL